MCFAIICFPVWDVINFEIKVNKSAYIAKSRQRRHKTLNNILLHVSKYALKDMYMLNYGTIKINSFIDVLIDFVNPSLQYTFF